MKENPHIEKHAADTLLQKGVKISIRSPFFIRLFKKTLSLTITSPYEGTMLRFSSYYLSTGITADQLDSVTVEKALELRAKHGKTMAKCVAVAVLNGYVSGWLFTKPLAKYLLWNCKPVELLTLVNVLVLYSGTEDFMSTTKLVRKMKITTPTMGQRTQGS